MSEKTDSVVIGAGVVGLAVARALARSGREVVVLEATGLIGSATSSRNSEVIHAGIYYPTNSLKASLCVAGKHALYDYCASRNVAHRRIGKLIVASEPDELATLDTLQRQALANGVADLRFLSAAEVKTLEPELNAVGALLSPSTGIIDSHGLMLAYQGEAEAAGAMIAFETPVLGGAIEDRAIVVETGGDAPMRLKCRHLVNAAGLTAQAVATHLEGFPRSAIPPSHLAKGNYYGLSGRAPFRHLIYPAPVPGGLGVHITVDLTGRGRFGPDVEWIDEIDYTVDPGRADAFYAAVRRYWPGLQDGVLEPDYAGIRPKLTAAGEPAGDFVIQGPAVHGIDGLVNLFGIESPGLTASLAIADRVLDYLELAATG